MQKPILSGRFCDQNRRVGETVPYPGDPRIIRKIWHICDRWLTASRSGLDVIPVTLSQTVCHLVSCRVWSIPIRSWGHPYRKKVCCQWRIIICGEYSAEGHKFFKPSSLIPFSFFHFSFIINDSIITIKCINQQPLNNGVLVYFQTSGTFTIN